MQKTWSKTAVVLFSGCAVAMIAIATRPHTAAAQTTRPAHAHATVAGTYCDQSTPCGSGFYCATDATSPVCGAGICTASPQVCPGLWTVGECTCDGNWYINTNCAQMRGATVLGPRAIAGAAMTDIVGTWTRVISQNTSAGVEYDETLTVDADGTYTLMHTDRCLPKPGNFCWHGVRVNAEATGTIAAGANGGFVMQGSCVTGDCSTLATEVILVHNCGDYNGALQLAITPPSDSPESTAYYLNRQ
jgi:hypothetical protein